ncbi:hypothetical protein RI367_003503 [Sorochytrium milnesiophthora]
MADVEAAPQVMEQVPAMNDQAVDVAVPDAESKLQPALNAATNTTTTESQDEPAAAPEAAPTEAKPVGSNTLFNKRYLGGYRDKRSGTEYYHAATQTMTPMERRKLRTVQGVGTLYHRDTQTKFIRHRLAQTKRETATQMEKRGVYLSPDGDYELTPQRYFSSEEKDALVLRSAIRIQCFFRRVIAKRRAAQLRELQETKRRVLQEKERRRAERSEKKRRKEIEQRVHPKTKKDFELLYSGLETWRAKETDRIHGEAQDDAERTHKMTELLNQEAVLIQKIEGLKVTAAEEREEKAITRKLNAMSGPKKWPLARGGFAMVETPSTLRAKDLSELYRALRKVPKSVDERLKVLVRLKYTVREFDHPLTRDIVNLVEREGDLLSRGRDESCLSGLRQRINSLFLQFMEVPEFNPEAAAFVSALVHGTDNDKATNTLYLCNGCCRYLASTQFYLSTERASSLKRCRACLDKSNVAINRNSDSEYTRIITKLRNTEAARSVLPKRQPIGDGETVAPVPPVAIVQQMNEAAVRYLIDITWNGQSALSGERDLARLVLTRWDPREAFAPWNCILLTEDEAETHERCGGSAVYGEEFVRKATARLQVARQKYQHLLGE